MIATVPFYSRLCPDKDEPRMTKEETEAIKSELRTIGRANFMRKYVQGATQYSLEEVLYALGYILVRMRI